MFIVFFTETYIDLLLGSLLNSENFHLLNDPKNWGSKATAMSQSDQIAIFLGVFFYSFSMTFPFAVVILLDKAYSMRFWPVHKRHQFNILYDFLYDGLKTNQQGIF